MLTPRGRMHKLRMNCPDGAQRKWGGNGTLALGYPFCIPSFDPELFFLGAGVFTEMHILKWLSFCNLEVALAPGAVALCVVARSEPGRSMYSVLRSRS